MLPEIDKTPMMRLVEAMDPAHRDVREVVRESYGRHGTLDGVAEELGALIGQPIPRATIHRWVSKEWRMRFSRVMTLPATEPVEVAQ